MKLEELASEKLARRSFPLLFGGGLIEANYPSRLNAIKQGFPLLFGGGLIEAELPLHGT